MTKMSIISVNSNFTGLEEGDWDSYSSNMNLTIYSLNNEAFLRELPALLYMAILLSIGLPGNISIIVIFRTHYKRTIYRKFVVALAIVDTVACSASLPFEIIDIRFPYTFYVAEICKIFKTISCTVFLTSCFLIVGLSIDRYRHVCQPFKVQMSEKISTIICVSSCIIASLFAWPYYILSGIRKVDLMNNITGSDCFRIADEYKSTDYPFYHNAVLIFIFITATISMIIIYSLIGRAIYKQEQFRKKFRPESMGNNKIRKDMPTESTTISEGHSEQATTTERTDTNSIPNNRQSNRSNYRTKQKITKVACAISALFIMSFLPHLIVTILTAEIGDFDADSNSVASIILSITTRSVFLNSVGNPFVYGVFDKRFRRGLKKYICFCRPNIKKDDL